MGGNHEQGRQGNRHAKIEAIGIKKRGGGMIKPCHASCSIENFNHYGETVIARRTPMEALKDVVEPTYRIAERLANIFISNEPPR